MNTDDKILSLESASITFEELRSGGRQLVHCHGTFDLVHPGHVHHLEEARAFGDCLVVTLTSDKHVNKGPGRPFFNDRLRAKSLAALECVDYVVIIPFPGAAEAIRCVKPRVYCKGREYEDPANDLTGRISEDVATVQEFGGEVRYVGSVVFSSTRLLNNHFDHLERGVKEFCRSLTDQYSPAQFVTAVEDLSKLRVLLIGDIIFDRYTTVHTQGLTSKNRILSARYLESDLQAGGALAVYRHMQQFCPAISFLSIAGNEPELAKVISEVVQPEHDWIVRDSNFTTVVKERYVEPHSPGKELVKLFSLNYIDAQPPSSEMIQRVGDRLAQEIGNFDVVAVADFGHGIMQPEIRNLVQRDAAFLSINCQTNSNNHGFNIISNQYRRADAFSLDEQELLLACAQRSINHTEEMEKIREAFGAKVGWLTRGPVETISVARGEPPCQCPPLEINVVDTIGAGDAFFSLASLGAARGLPHPLTTFLGQLAGAQAVRIIGNRRSVSKVALLKGGTSLLNL